MAIAIALLASGCHDRPQPTAPPGAQVGGVWLGEQTVTAVEGGECLRDTLLEATGFPEQFHATIVQQGADITATLDIDHTGGVCTFTGRIDGAAIELHTVSCTPSRQIALRCPNGDLRDILQVSETLSGSVTGDTITATAIERDTIVVSGTTGSAGSLTLTSTAVLARR